MSGIYTEKFYRPINNPEEWKPLLAKPDRHWKTGYSAKALAYSWQEASGFPLEIRQLFQDSGIGIFQDIEVLVAFPEYKVPLLGGRRASQNDIFVLAKGNGQLISIMVEGKASEPFGDTIADWKAQVTKGKAIRLRYLCNLLGLDVAQVNYIRYQLLHRTASAFIEAQRFNAPNALMFVHSFSTENEWFEDYQQLLALFGVRGEINSLTFAKNINGVDLYFGWAKGHEKYLNLGMIKMDVEEFRRQLDELRNIISDGIAYFSAWKGIMVGDKDSAQSLNRYNGLFLPARNALLWSALMQFAKVFDRDPRTVSLRNMLTAAKNNQKGLTPYATNEDLLDIEQKIDASETLLERLKGFRDQRLAHHDATVTSKVSLLFGEVQRLIDEVKSMYNSLRRVHDRSTTAFDYLARKAERNTSEVVSIMREEKDRALRRIKRAESRIKNR